MLPINNRVFWNMLKLTSNAESIFPFFQFQYNWNQRPEGTEESAIIIIIIIITLFSEGDI